MLGRPLAARGEGPLLFGPNSKALSPVPVQCGAHSGSAQCRLSFERNVTIVGSLGLQLALLALTPEGAESSVDGQDLANTINWATIWVGSTGGDG